VTRGREVAPLGRAPPLRIHRAAAWPISCDAPVPRTAVVSVTVLCVLRAASVAAGPYVVEAAYRWRRESGWAQQRALHFEQRSGEAVGVGTTSVRTEIGVGCGDDLPTTLRTSNRSSDRTSRELLHTLVVGETGILPGT